MMTKPVDGSLDGAYTYEAKCPCKVEYKLAICEWIIDGNKTGKTNMLEEMQEVYESSCCV